MFFYTSEFLFTTRVTRLGDFSPTGPLFPLGSLLENYRSSQNSGLFLSTVEIMHKILQKMGGILGDIFQKNSSGQPGVDVMITIFCDFYPFSAKK
jgi:hypothetical protein